jgi:thiamine pyrophosphate-dependent acetolactate synthase large subunit-like protein
MDAAAPAPELLTRNEVEPDTRRGPHGADCWRFFWQRLFDWGVRRVFGYPGDAVNGLLGALQRRKGDIEFIQARHEEMAAFMASAHAKFTGELGVCVSLRYPADVPLTGDSRETLEALLPLLTTRD